MVSVDEPIHRQLDDATISQLSRELGLSEDKTRQAVPLALTALLGGLERNSADPAGAQQLSGALARDHDGSLLDNLGGLFGNAAAGQGGGILQHIFGGRRPTVESNVGRATGLDAATAGRLLLLLAPFVLGALGRRQRQQNLSPGDLPDVIARERQHAEQAAPGGLGGLGSLLDADHDGQIMDDLAGMVGGFLRGGKR